MPPPLLQKPIFEPNFLNVEYLFSVLFQWMEKAYAFFVSAGGVAVPSQALLFLKNVSWLVTALLVVGIIYSFWQIHKVKKAEKEKLEEAEISAARGVESTERNTQWERVLDLVESSSESDWKLAIMEADTMLGAMLTTMGYVGDTIGDQLKGIEVSDFTTINDAWEAHKVRNQIAHEGMAFPITKRLAKEVIDLYRRVFEEFHFI